MSLKNIIGEAEQEDLNLQVADNLIGDNVYLDEVQLAAMLDISPRTLQGQRQRGEGPPYIKVGRLVRYRPIDVKRHYDGRMRVSTSQEAA